MHKLGEALFTHYLFAFEITSVLLVIAVVAAVVLARRAAEAPVFDTDEDAVEAEWRVVDPVIGDDATPLYEYDPGTWGPEEANQLVAGDGGWSEPS